MGYWRQKADERLDNLHPQGNQEAFVVKDKVEVQMSLRWVCK